MGPIIEGKLGTIGIVDPWSLPWPVLARKIESAIVYELDKETREEFYQEIGGTVSAKVAKARDRAERQGMNPLRAAMEVELAKASTPAARRAVHEKYRNLAAERRRKAGMEPRQLKGKPKPSKGRGSNVPAAEYVGHDPKGRRMMEADS